MVKDISRPLYCFSPSLNVPDAVPAAVLRLSTREIDRSASRRFHPPLSRTHTLYQNRRARIKRGCSFVGRLTTEYTETPLATRIWLEKSRPRRRPALFNTIYKRNEGWLRKAEGLISPTTFRVRRAVSETSVVQNAVLYIGIENAFWVKKSCRKAKDSFNGLKRKSALDRHATVHWMDTTASIQLKFMRPLDGQTRYNPIETCVSMGWTQRPPPHAGNLSPGIAAVSPASQPNAHIIP